MGQLGKKIQKIGERLTIQKPDKETVKELREDKYDLAFDWLENLRCGKWIVRLCQIGLVDHCIAIDADRKLILDSAEEYPMELCDDAIRCCGGAEAEELHVAEVLQIKCRN